MPTENTNIGWTDNEQLRDRLMEKVNVDTESGCWEWTAASNSEGYGRIRVNNKLLYAHRVSYRIHKGEIPDGMQVNHHCDNPACICPDHIYTGTQKENISDAKEHGDLIESRARGTKNGRAVLNEEKAREIRRLYETTDHTHRSLANKFDVGKGTIQNVLQGETWTHLNSQESGT